MQVDLICVYRTAAYVDYIFVDDGPNGRCREWQVYRSLENPEEWGGFLRRSASPDDDFGDAIDLPQKMAALLLLSIPKERL